MAAAAGSPPRAAARIRTNQKAWKCIRDMNSAGREDLDRLAIWEEKRRYSYGQMFRQWERYAAVFSALGMTGEEHARVGLMANTASEVIFAMYGLNMVGAKISLISDTWSLSMERVLYTIRQEKLTDFIVTDILAPPGLTLELLKRKEELGLHNVILLHLPVAGAGIHGAVSAAQESKYLYLKAWYVPVCMETLLKVWGEGPVRYAPFKSGDNAFILHTSGTTGGMGKPVPLSDRAFNAVGACFARMDGLELPETLITALVVDLSNVYGVVDQVHLPLCMGGEHRHHRGGRLKPGLL